MAAPFEFKVLTPDGKKFVAKTDLLTIKTTDGYIGIMKNHAPLEAICDIGELKFNHIEDKNYSEEFIAIGGGLLHISKNEVIILADSFETKEEIDLKRALEAKTRAESRISSKDTNVDVKRAEIALKKALNRINISSR